MTLNLLCRHLVKMSGGHLNGECFSEASLRDYIGHWFGKADNGIDRIKPVKGIKRWMMTISLPDGEWYFMIYQFADGNYDYDIPENREQEFKWFGMTLE